MTINSYPSIFAIGHRAIADIFSSDVVVEEKIDGLSLPWFGTVFMNPPFGGRNGHVPWLEKFLAHENGIAIVRAYTSSAWFHDYAIKAETMLFPRGKTKFIRPDGSVGKAPGHGIVMLGVGLALYRSGLGFVVSVSGRG